MKRIVVGSDHAGRALKDRVTSWLRSWGYDVVDVGTHGDDSVDFPDFAFEVAQRVQSGAAERGVLVCGSGVGVAIAANKVAGIRASVCHDTYSARQGVEHDDLNVLCLGGQVVGAALAEEIVRAFIGASFDGDERFRRRVGKIAAIEDGTLGGVGARPGRLAMLHELGQSPWLDSIDRSWLTSGELERMRDEFSLRGVTSNPTIFAGALRGAAYDADIARLASEGRTDDEIFEVLATDDIRRACDVFHEVWELSGGTDGHVSIELEPNLADDAEGSIERARHLWRLVNRPNLMIKVPATDAGLPVIETLIAEGINVNVTLLFDVAVYEDVMDRHMAGLERRINAGLPVDQVASVASFFVSRVDSAVDPLLIDTDADVEDLLGTIAVANARAAYVAWRATKSSERWHDLAAEGAQPQRPLWASTGTKNPAYSDVLYVDELIGPSTVNTMPLATIKAFSDHGSPVRTLTEATCADAESRLARLETAGVDLDVITEQLRSDGLASFQASYDELLQTIASRR